MTTRYYSTVYIHLCDISTINKTKPLVVDLRKSKGSVQYSYLLCKTTRLFVVHLRNSSDCPLGWLTNGD